MTKIAATLVLFLLLCAPGYSDIVTWGSASLSDNNGGAFLSGFSVTASGSQWILDLPNFSQSDFASFSGEIDLSVSADDTASALIGVMFTYFGLIDQTNGPATVSYVQTASGSLGALGDFSATPFSGTLFRPASNHIDLTTQINLTDSGGLASISKIQFDLIETPEPSSLPMVLAVLGGLAVCFRHRMRVRVN
jgi:hypothetical protein